MASAFEHAFTAYTLKNFTTNPLLNNKFLFFVVASSIMPDIDILAFRFDIAYSDLWGHRGMTHSLLFAFIWSIFLWFIILRSSDYRHQRFISKTSITAITILFLSTSSHGILDAMTNGGLGVAFFSPFDTTPTFYPGNPYKFHRLGWVHFSAPPDCEFLSVN